MNKKNCHVIKMQACLYKRDSRSLPLAANAYYYLSKQDNENQPLTNN